MGSGMGEDSGWQAQMNSTHQRPGTFSGCFLVTLLVRDYSSRLTEKNLQAREKTLVPHNHTASGTHSSGPGSLHLAAGKLELTHHCVSLYTWYKSRRL